MTKVLVDARHITPNRSGIGRYAESLMNALDGLEVQANTYYSLQAPSMPDGVANFEAYPVQQKIGNLVDYLGSHREISPIIKSLGPDLFHSFFHITPKFLKPNCPTILTLHDTIWIDHAETSQPTRFTATTIREFAKRAIPDSLRRADHVICVSEATASRASEWISRDKMTVIGHGVDKSFFQIYEENKLVKSLTSSSRKYICAIGNDKPYKNLKLLIDSFEALNDESLNLVLIGKCEAFRDHIRGLKSQERIILAGMLDDLDLKKVLSHASLFVFPSLVEGFGLPILEAMAAGIPTIISDLEPMRSVGGDAALRFNPKDGNALSETISRALVPANSEALSAGGEAHAKKQTWENAAQCTIEVYEHVLNNSK